MVDEKLTRSQKRFLIRQDLDRAFAKRKRFSQGRMYLFRIMDWEFMNRKEADGVAKAYALGYIIEQKIEEVYRAIMCLGVKEFWQIVDGIQKSPDVSKFRPRGKDNELRSVGSCGYKTARCSRLY